MRKDPQRSGEKVPGVSPEDAPTPGIGAKPQSSQRAATTGFQAGKASESVNSPKKVVIQPAWAAASAGVQIPSH